MYYCQCNKCRYSSVCIQLNVDYNGVVFSYIVITLMELNLYFFQDEHTFLAKPTCSLFNSPVTETIKQLHMNTHTT